MPAQGRIGDKSLGPADSHGCPACPHAATGPAVSGSANVIVNGRPALRVGDTGVHASCCGENTWTAVTGSSSVLINNRPAHRLNDTVQHCGGMGLLTEGSSNVSVGEQQVTRLSRTADSQTGTLSVTVQRLRNNRPLAGITVTVSSDWGNVAHSQQTNAEGRADFFGLPTGPYKITANHKKYNVGAKANFTQKHHGVHLRNLLNVELAENKRSERTLHARKHPHISIVQCNIYIGGAKNAYGSKRPDIPPVENFAIHLHDLVKGDFPGLAIIGMQEVNLSNAKAIRKALRDRTGHGWLSKTAEMGNPNHTPSGVSIFWRPKLLTLIKHEQIDIDYIKQRVGFYTLRAVGGLFETMTGKRFGFFTCKLYFDHPTKEPKKSKASRHRHKEAKTLLRWIAAFMASEKSAPRIIAMDMNSFDKGPETTFSIIENAAYVDGSAGLGFTAPAKPRPKSKKIPHKIDFLWYWKKRGYKGAAHRSEPYGSDHRFLWARTGIV